jgi:HD-like signal output (HDOD) protein/prolyl-tRNA editing enzyme YbaK/EbsC (Cys-tRNA(Pro) deacylase)
LPVPSPIKEQLEQLGVAYEAIELPQATTLSAMADHLADDAAQLLRVVGLKSENQTLLAVLPYTYLLDIKAISNQLDSEVSALSIDETNALFQKSTPPSQPPIAGLVNCRMLIDNSVLQLPYAFIESGDPRVLLKLSRKAVDHLFAECKSLEFAAGPERLYAGRERDSGRSDIDVSFTPIRLRQRIDDTFDLPAMPEIAQDIMKLRVDPSADATKLGRIVCRDPSLAAQVISWASSPYYGYQGKVDSIETAIARVLGFELVMNLALGISIGKSLKLPMDGPLGVREFWKQAIYCANLSEKLCRAMPVKQRPERGLIYLSGLLHNFGHLLLGHIFPPQFNLVNNTILANPHIRVEDIEFYILGVTHEEIGAWLMQNWHMPDELIVAVHRHHQEEFWSKHAVYSNIVLVANRLLKRISIGDSVETRIPPTTLELLALDTESIESALKDIELESETLDIMAKQLVA